MCRIVILTDKNKALGLAVGRANKEAVYFLVKVVKADVNAVIDTKFPETPLMIAAYYGSNLHQEIATFLISNNAEINKPTAREPISTALTTAIWKDNLDFVKLLIKNGADPSLSFGGKKEDYACRFALEKKRSHIIPYIPKCCDLAEKNSTWMRESGYLCP